MAVVDFPALTILRGGRDPEEIARLEEEAAILLDELADMLPHDDRLKSPISALAGALDSRCGRRKFQREWNAIRGSRTIFDSEAE